ncbi:TPR-like protein [Amylocystis lapponica]|nr:TPR-like protein [Amylocystis lapponica]
MSRNIHSDSDSSSDQTSDEPDFGESSGSSGSEDDYGLEDHISERDDSEDEDEEAVVHTDHGDSRAEAAIEGDFDLLVQTIRQAGGGSGSGMLSKVWDVSLEEKEPSFSTTCARHRASGAEGRRKAGPVLSQQVRSLIGEGNQAYVDNDIPETIRIMQEVIRIEPRAASAWSVLAQCHEDAGEPQKALQLRIMAAHLTHDADEWDRLARQSMALGHNQQALYCYGKLYSLDPSNVNALWDRASLARDIGALRIARNTLLAMLKRLPHNLTVLDELRPLLIELAELPLCAELFADAFAHYRDAFPGGVGLAREVQREVPGGGFGLMQLFVLADLRNTLGAHEEAIRVIRAGCRWLQGRGAQRFWDACEDDREYDVAEGVKMGDVDEGKIHAGVVLTQDPVEYAPLFGEIADAYFERELYAEAGRIYEILGKETATSSVYVLLQAAACQRMVGNIKEAAEIYEHIISVDTTHNEAKMKLAEIYEILNEPRKALDLVMQVIDSRKRHPREATVDDESAEPGTMSLFEEKARTKGKAAKANRLPTAQLRELEAQKERDVVQGFHRVRELWVRMLADEEDAVREWIVEAEKLVESFRETRNLFLTSRHQGFRGMFPRTSRKQTAEANEENMVARLQLELGRDGPTHTSHKAKSDGAKSATVTTFRTVSFDDWLRLFIHYAFLLTRRGQYDLANEVLRHITFSNAYQNRVAQDAIRLAIMACAAKFGEFQTVVEQARKIINAYQFNNEPLRILLVSLGGGLRATDAFLASTLSKHLLREIRQSDVAVKQKDRLRWNATVRRYSLAVGKAEPDDGVEDEDEVLRGESPGALEKSSAPKVTLPTKDNPIGVAVYGQICLAAKSYQSALFYFLHAFDYCPHDPLICLCLGIASLGRAMQRQSDNRHHLVTQGMAFLSRYRTLREHDVDGMDEVDFNFGRAFQQLGLHSLAVRHYEHVLERAEGRLQANTGDYGLAREAAYNLSLIFVTTGATPLAQNLYRRWLSL